MLSEGNGKINLNCRTRSWYHRIAGCGDNPQTSSVRSVVSEAGV